MPRSSCWRWRRPGRLMNWQAPGWTCCAGRSRSPRAWAATPRRCLLEAAKRLESLDSDLARETYLSAWMAALFVGRLSGAAIDGGLPCRRGACARSTRRSSAALVLDALTMLVTDGHRPRQPALRASRSRLYRDSISAEEELSWLWLAGAATVSAVWDDDPWRAMLQRHVQLARDVGALDRAPDRPGLPGTAHRVDRRLHGGLGSDRGDRCGLHGDREPQRDPSPPCGSLRCGATKPKPPR